MLDSKKMRRFNVLRWSFCAASTAAVALVVGRWLPSWVAGFVGGLALYWFARKLSWVRPAPPAAPAVTIQPLSSAEEEWCADTPAPSVTNPGDAGELAKSMMAQNRYALLLRRQIVANLSAEQYARARETLAQQMALVPAGEVTLSWTEMEDEPERGKPGDDHGPAVYRISALFLDRYPVTNRQFRQFVVAGGYEQVSIWDPQIWPAVLDFLDATGCPGPRYWKNARYPKGADEHPVVGVSWYEAAAYARWVGKRLPSDPEWVKAGSWPVPLADATQWQRRFPWGDTMDRQRCNLWGSGPGRVVAVCEFPEGVSVGGVYQLIGNVWEWTTGNFGSVDCLGRDIKLPVPMKSIRGGAFDTYFENQATCQFQSGENPLARKHNIGFRCALSLCDVAPPALSPRAAPEPEETEEVHEAQGAHS